MSDGNFSDLLDRIRARIRPVCSQMPEDEFNKLTRGMAEIEWRSINRDSKPSLFEPKPPE